MPFTFNQTLIDQLVDGSPPPKRRAALLTLLTNICLVPESDFQAIYCSRDEAILTLQDEIMLWSTEA